MRKLPSWVIVSASNLLGGFQLAFTPGNNDTDLPGRVVVKIRARKCSLSLLSPGKHSTGVKSDGDDEFHI